MGKFHSRLCASRTGVGRRQVVEFDQNLGKCHTWAHPSGIAAAVLVDGEYPQRVAITLLSEAVRTFIDVMAGRWERARDDVDLDCFQISELFRKFQSPSEADK